MVRILCKAAWGDGRAECSGGREVVAGPCPYPRGGAPQTPPLPPTTHPPKLPRQLHEHWKLSGQWGTNVEWRPSSWLGGWRGLEEGCPS